MRGGPVDEVRGGGVQALVTRIQPHVHHQPALEVNVAGLPLLAGAIALEDEGALAGADVDVHFLSHRCLLLEVGCAPDAERSTSEPVGKVHPGARDEGAKL